MHSNAAQPGWGASGDQVTSKPNGGSTPGFPVIRDLRAPLSSRRLPRPS
jgi:hypothetical protein